MFSQTDMTLYAGFMVYIATNHPKLYIKITGQVPRRVRVILNEELGVEVDALDELEPSIRKYMQALKTRELMTPAWVRSAVPPGYALISVDLLKQWGKHELVQAACVYPIPPQEFF